ncbi:MAG TPA: hypothetical protein VFN57_08765 [Thermomicrobiaceae bacterium]|nr:hypothetical protein [Thermomicrobiaceae bacterium]
MRRLTPRPAARSRLGLLGVSALLLAALLAACGGSPSPAASPTVSPPGTYTAPAGSLPGSPGGPSAGTPAANQVVTPLPITGVNVSLSTSEPRQVVAHVSGYLPNTCARAGQPQISRSGQTVTVRIDIAQPADAVCGQVATPYRTDVPLGSFSPGGYTLLVNTTKTTFYVG